MTDIPAWLREEADDLLNRLGVRAVCDERDLPALEAEVESFALRVGERLAQEKSTRPGGIDTGHDIPGGGAI